ncbi:dimethylhistidine N-methyltransferase/ergothioneine biosynthesis protein EgtC [Streptacidiphilus sp. MAP12-33]
MCRHLTYLGPVVPLAEVVLRPARGLYEQSWSPRRQRHGTVNADGFGLGWYPEPVPADREEDEEAPEPARYRRAVPIWADPNLPELARAVRSGAILAAVRSATAGTTQDEAAAAPFRDGRYLFSHNGVIPDWTRLPAAVAASGTPGADAPLDSAALLALEARSDSALLWAMLVRRLRRGEPAGGALAALVRQVASVRPDARLNLLLTDGASIAATRFGDTLWYRCAPGRVLVASEPDDELAGSAGSTGSTGSTGGEWQEVPDHSLVLATRAGARILRLRPPARTPKQSTDSLSRTPRSAHEQDRGTEPERLTMITQRQLFTLDNRLPADHLAKALRHDVVSGLTADPKTLPPKWFYDEHGSELFERITHLAEYYPTRAEQEILTRRAPEIAALTRAGTLFELGSGSSRKTRLLLDALTAAGTLSCYAPLDVSPSALEQAGAALIRDYPGLRVAATVTDFETDLTLPPDAPGPRLVAFLGSTIGNLDEAQRQAFYRALRLTLSADDVLLLGADLVKDREVLLRAYDDSLGVTAEFDKNVLGVLNRELDADFDPDAFAHVARWNEEHERIEMHLRSLRDQTVKIPALDLSVEFATDEHLRTEISCKFRRASLTEELATGGFTVRHWWTDDAERFALLLAVPTR